jgi:uncharacterized protein YecE (DUF72 family)
MPFRKTLNPDGRIRVGVGGWSFEPWRGVFYPADLPKTRELEYASRKLTSIEINATYYRLQQPETFAKWRDETPDDFVFAVKGGRHATNRRVLAEAGESIERFFVSGVLLLGDKLGPINWQFAATKKFDPEDFGAFLALLPDSIEGREIRHAVEVRHDSFKTPAFVELARQRGVAVVVAGDSEFPLITDVTAPLVYARIMGANKTHKLGYAPGALDVWADRARIWAAGGSPADLPLIAPAPNSESARDVFLYAISGFKERNPAAALALIERLSPSKATARC